jgi:hypothetical protein
LLGVGSAVAAIIWQTKSADHVPFHRLWFLPGFDIAVAVALAGIILLLSLLWRKPSGTMTPEAWAKEVLSHLATAPRTESQLAHDLGLRVERLEEMVRALEARGLVERREGAVHLVTGTSAEAAGTKEERQTIANALGEYFQEGQRLVGEAREVAEDYKANHGSIPEIEVMGPVVGSISRGTEWFKRIEAYVQTLSSADQAIWRSSIGLPEPAPIGFDSPDHLVRCYAGIWNRLVRTQELIHKHSGTANTPPARPPLFGIRDRGTRLTSKKLRADESFRGQIADVSGGAAADFEDTIATGVNSTPPPDPPLRRDDPADLAEEAIQLHETLGRLFGDTKRYQKDLEPRIKDFQRRLWENGYSHPRFETVLNWPDPNGGSLTALRSYLSEIRGKLTREPENKNLDELR